MQTELLRKSRDHESLNTEGEALMSTSEKDQDVIKEQLDAVNSRWQQQEDGVNNRLQVSWKNRIF